MNVISKSFIPLIACVCLINTSCQKGTQQEFKAEAPIDHEERQKYGFGSVLDQGSILGNVFHPKEDKSKSEKQKKDSSILEVKKSETTKPISKRDKLFDSASLVLKDFPLIKLDKNLGRIETDEAKVAAFDNTNTCSYKIIVAIDKNSEVSVIVSSKEDSKVRLKMHEKTLKNDIERLSEGR